MPLIISYIICWNGAFLINNFVDFWYWWISLRVTVPGLNLLFFFSCCDGGLCGAFVAMFFEALVILLAAPSIPFLAVCFVLAILGVDLDKVFCKMTVIHVLLLRHLSSQKSQPSIGSIFHQLIILAVSQTSKLLLGRLCFQECLVYDCNHPNTQLHIQT